MSPAMKQLLETMCGGDFLSKNPEEALDFLNYVVEESKGWDEQPKGNGKHETSIWLKRWHVFPSKRDGSEGKTVNLS